METAARGLYEFMEGKPLTVKIYEMEQPDVLLWAVWAIQQYAKYVGREKCNRKYGKLLYDILQYIVSDKHPNLQLRQNGLLYTSPDMLGMELGGSLKNVIALAAGMADGLGYGDNTKAALITRGIAEISRLAVAMGAKQATLNGLTGIGDLIVTCESKHSRNRKAGMLIGQGYTMQQAMDEVKMVVEGVYSAKAALALAKEHNVELPIIEEVNEVLFADKPAKKAVKDLMIREKRPEHTQLEWES